MSGKNSNNHNNSDEKNLNMEGKNYEEYIEQEIIKETYLTEESDMDRIMFLVKEINKINPLKDIDESKSLDEFCKKYNVTVQSNYPKVRLKSIIALVAAMLLILGLSSVVVVGNKFNLFNMDFNDSEKQVHYTSENETV